MAAAEAAAKTKTLFSSLKLTHNVTKTSSGSEVHSYSSDLGPNTPILTLVHGYPQSAYEWRYVVPALQGKVSLFVPELPGYGTSTPIKERAGNTKRGVGSALIEALASVFKTSSTPRRVILGGHDRGARICHRLSVDFSHPPSGVEPLYKNLNLTVVGTVLLDIVPTKAQWEAFANPAVCAGYFHWPLLANPEVAVEVISAYGGAKWAKEAHTRIGGKNPASLARITADGALDVYGALFDSRETLFYTALDYEAGAAFEVSEQEDDQKAGRKIGTPSLIMYSKSNLGARIDVEGIWKTFVGDGVENEIFGVGDNCGHYLPEEASTVVIPKIERFLKQFL